MAANSASDVIAAIKAHPAAAKGILLEVEPYDGGKETEISLTFDKTGKFTDEAVAENEAELTEFANSHAGFTFIVGYQRPSKARGRGRGRG